MSDLRVRRAMKCGRGSLAFVLVLLLVAPGCGSGESAEPAPPDGITLPEVGTLGRLPGGPGTIVVEVSADGRITLGDRGPLSLVDLRDELTRRTADPIWRERDYSSRKILLIHADASLPWTVAQWIMQVAAGPRVKLYRIFYGARAESTGAVGALGCALPKDRGLPRRGWVEPPPRLALSVVPGDGIPSEPEDILAPLRAAAGKRPLGEFTLDVAARGKSNGEIPTGFVIRVVDVALRAGVGRIQFVGAFRPPPSQANDVQALLDHVAELRQRLRAPDLYVGREVVAARPASEPVPEARGRLAYLLGSGVERQEWDPTRAARDAPTHGDLPEEEIEEESFMEEPVIQDEELEEPILEDGTAGELPYEESLGAEGLSDAPFTGPVFDWRPRAGIFPTRKRGEKKRSDPVERALRWLAAHQAPSGGWEARGFGRWCDLKEVLEQDRARGWGRAEHDVGVTGLALSAFLGAGYTSRGKHDYAKTVSRGLRYLKNVQDAEGCFGPRTPGRFVYDHAAAALAMVEAYGMTSSPIYKGSAQKAVDFILQCRNPGGGWRYGIRPGTSDTSVTAWMTMPLIAARWINADAKEQGRSPPLDLDEAVLDAVHAWIGALTDPATGRTGYLDRGGRPDRPPEQVKWFPPTRSESTTAAALALRVFLGEDPDTSDVLQAGGALLRALPPAWNPDRGTIDHVYWYFGTLAMVQFGGASWDRWSAALHRAVVGTQRADTNACEYLGSWDPIGPWGPEGGRVASTALMALCLEAPYRYARGSRTPR